MSHSYFVMRLRKIRLILNRFVSQIGPVLSSIYSEWRKNRTLVFFFQSNGLKSVVLALCKIDLLHLELWTIERYIWCTTFDILHLIYFIWYTISDTTADALLQIWVKMINGRHYWTLLLRSLEWTTFLTRWVYLIPMQLIIDMDYIQVNDYD